MFSILILSSILACDEASSTSTGPVWSSEYGECAVGSQNIVSGEDLGEPLVYLVEIETANGWVPLSLSDNTSSPILRRDEETGLWLACPEGVSGWHASWAR